MQRFEDHFLTRREVMRIGSVAMTGYHFLPLVQPRIRAGSRVTPRGSARFCIFVMLEGGASHVDSWDFKEGPLDSCGLRRADAPRNRQVAGGPIPGTCEAA